MSQQDTITPEQLRQQQAEAMTEDELFTEMIERMDTWGWTWMHIPDRLYKLAAKQARWDAMFGAKGFPDLILLRNERIIAAELKRQNAEPRPEQRAWLQAFEDAGAETYIWKPLDLLDQTIDFVLA